VVHGNLFDHPHLVLRVVDDEHLLGEERRPEQVGRAVEVDTVLAALNLPVLDSFSCSGVHLQQRAALLVGRARRTLDSQAVAAHPYVAEPGGDAARVVRLGLDAVEYLPCLPLVEDGALCDFLPHPQALRRCLEAVGRAVSRLEETGDSGVARGEVALAAHGGRRRDQ
jgi:hypothetical protein